MSLSCTERERNYVQAKFPGRPRELCYGMRYLTGRQLKRIRHRIHRGWARNGPPVLWKNW